ncbi:MAG: chemotaxis response regulator protein-glutamate methylesterase [Verrucomicrobiota bacterium]
MPGSKPIRVLIVDDSASVRQTLQEILDSDPGISVMGTAQDPFVAVEFIRKEVPDVITLDVEMPRMDGITFLERIMSQHPIPVVICSTLTENGSETALAALEKGAVEIITKPKLATKQFLEESRICICDTVKSAAQVRVQKRRASPPAPPIKVAPKLTADAMLPMPASRAMIETTEKVVAVGASTGGTEALRLFLEAMPANAPGILIVQHMPEKFTADFAGRLDQLCRVNVREAADGDSVVRGQALIAPGGKHLLLKRSGARYYVEVRDGPLVCRHRPSVDVLFRSTARYAGKNAVGVIMTGMGDDGAHGMLEMKQAGAYNIAQDESSCVVFGMPAEAIRLGGVDRILPLPAIAPEVVRLCKA